MRTHTLEPVKVVTPEIRSDESGGIQIDGYDIISLEIEGTSVIYVSSSSIALKQATTVPDHGTASTDQVVNVCYGTSETPPTASDTTEGAIYIQYVA